MSIVGENKYFTLIRTPEGDNDAWLEQRRKGIGGSDVAAIMGLSHYRGPYEVWAEKLGYIPPADLSDNEAVEWGNILEPVVGNHYASLHPDRIVRRVNAVCQSIERHHAQASLDYEVKDPELGWGILEIKTASLYREHDWDEGVPLHYITQITHYMSVTGRKFADVAVLIGGQIYKEFRVMRDEDDIRAVNKEVDDFWSMVVDDVEPPIGEIGAELKALAAKHRKPGEYIDKDATPKEALDWLKAKELCDSAKKRLQAATNKLCQLIGDDRGITTPDGRFTWSRYERNGKPVNGGIKYKEY